jgi:hypothetical protein
MHQYLPLAHTHTLIHSYTHPPHTPYARRSHRLVDTSYTSTKGIDPAMDPNSLSMEDPRNPLTIRRRAADAKDGKKRTRNDDL